MYYTFKLNVKLEFKILILCECIYKITCLYYFHLGVLFFYESWAKQQTTVWVLFADNTFRQAPSKSHGRNYKAIWMAICVYRLRGIELRDQGQCLLFLSSVDKPFLSVVFVLPIWFHCWLISFYVYVVIGI